MKKNQLSIHLLGASLALLFASACTPSDDSSGDGGETSAGDVNQTIIDVCAASCEAAQACPSLPSLPTCNDDCIAYLGGYIDDAQCLPLEIALTECAGGLSCDQLTQFAQRAPVPYPCQQELEASCGASSALCEISVGAAPTPSDCSVTETCEGQPERSVECAGQQCICYVDGVEAGGCADTIGVCGDLGSAVIDLCCGA